MKRRVGGRLDINNQIKKTICTINLQYYLLLVAGRGSLVSWTGTERACDVYVLISARSLNLG